MLLHCLWTHTTKNLWLVDQRHVKLSQGVNNQISNWNQCSQRVSQSNVFCMKCTQTDFWYQLWLTNQRYTTKGYNISVLWFYQFWISVRFSTVLTCKVCVYPTLEIKCSIWFYNQTLVGIMCQVSHNWFDSLCMWYFRCWCKTCHLTDCKCNIWSCIVVLIIFVINPFCDIWRVLPSCFSIQIPRYLVKYPSISILNPSCCSSSTKSLTFFLVGVSIPASSTYKNTINKPGQ